MSNLEVSGLFIYPVKSCQGIALQSAQTNLYGFAYDRFWMIVRYDNNKYLTQREQPKLALITPEIHETSADDAGGQLVLTALGIERKLVLPLKPNKDQYEALQVHIDREEASARDCGLEAADWITEFLGLRARIVFKPTDVIRPVPHAAYVPTADALGYQPQTAFSDGYPFLLLSEESIADVNAHLKPHVMRVGPRNFRPNILIRGCGVPFEEDTWKKIVINGEDGLFYVVSRCVRCTIPNVNPDTGERRSLEPLKTLQSYRRVDKGAKYKSCLGMNVIHATPGVVLRVGDPIRVLETGEHRR